MPAFEIPTSIELASYIEEINLDGVEFRLSFTFNERDDSWYLDIFDLNDVLLRAGVRVMNEFPLLNRWKDQWRPVGEIIALPKGSITDPAKIDQLGRDVVLFYLDAEGLAE